MNSTKHCSFLDVQLMPLPGELLLNIVVLDSGPLASCTKTWRNRHRSTWHNIAQPVRGGPIYGHRQHAHKFGEVRSCGFRVWRADKQTDRQTYTHYNSSHPFWGRSNNRWYRPTFIFISATCNMHATCYRVYAAYACNFTIHILRGISSKSSIQSTLLRNHPQNRRQLYR